MVGTNSQGVLIKFDRFGQPAFGGEDDTEVVECVGIIGFDSQGGLVVFACFGINAQRLQIVAQIVVHDGAVWIGGERGFAERDGIAIQLALLKGEVSQLR